MRRFVVSGLVNRRSRALALGAGVIVAAVSFVLLTAAAKSSAIHVRGSVKSNYRAAYDIVVRPRGSKTPLEQSQGLVRDNYLAGVFGGITLKQWHTIEHVRGVDVAAPIVNVGYLNLLGFNYVPLDRYLTKAPYQLFRVRYRFYANNNTWSYRGPTEYVYYERVHRMTPHGDRPPSEIIPCRKGCAPFGYRIATPCAGINAVGGFHPKTPFYGLIYESCFAARSPGGGYDAGVFNEGRYRVGHVGSATDLQFPIFLAGIDPTQEARLLHLDRTVVEGRFLRADERPWLVKGLSLPGQKNLRLNVPVIASTKTFVDERLVAQISRVQLPARPEVPDRLSTGFAYQWITKLKEQPLSKLSIPAQEIYSHLLSRRWAHGQLGSQLYWTTSPVRYRVAPDGVLHPRPVHNPFSVWSYFGGYWPAAVADADTQYRRLHERNSRNSWTEAGVFRQPMVHAVGRYEPSRLPEFSSLSRVPLETYYPPALEPANTASSKALGAKPLMPTENIGDYIQQPPLYLTSIQGALPFLSSNFYTTNGNQHIGAHAVTAVNAPISAIRIRVHGATGPDPLSQARVDTVARLIHDKTGLDVDITAGSSPHPLLVSLPKGRLGRPALLLREGWSKKGVAVSFVNALDRKDLALFTLILVIGAFFLANGALAAVKARRTEIGTLLTVGWSRGSIFFAVLAELAVVGLIAGLLGVAIALLLLVAFALHASIVQVVLVLPTAVGLAVVAGLLPACLAARGTPLDALRPPVVAAKRGRTVRHVLDLALVNVKRVPARALVGASGLVVGVAALTILIAIQHAFQGTLVGTLLGQALSVQVRGSDYVAVGLTIGLAMLSVADVLFLNLRERAAEFVTLITLGWSDRHLGFVVAIEALLLGLAGSAAGAVLGCLIGVVLLGVPLSALLLGAVIAAAGGIAAALVASLVPLSQLARLTAPTVLASE